MGGKISHVPKGFHEKFGPCGMFITQDTRVSLSILGLDDKIGAWGLANDKEKPRNVWKNLGRGFLKTIVRDFKIAAIGVGIGAGLGFLIAYVLGLSAPFGIRMGALLGGAIALLAFSDITRVFDEVRTPSDKERDS